MSQPTCHHVHANGALCKSPPLRDREYCHFHLDQIGRQLRAARARARQQKASLRSPLLEDPFAIHVAIMQLNDAVRHDEIDVPRGRLLLSILRFAERNLKAMRDWEQEPLFAAETNAITEWPTFEQENELPLDFDLSVDPEVAFPAPQGNSTGTRGSGAPYIPGVGMYGSDTDPLNPTAGLNETPVDGALRAQIRQALGEAKAPTTLVTADSVELMDIYEREGQKAATKFADQMVRNDRRRERRLQRAHYEELARNHNIKLAARRLVEDQQREAQAVAQTAQTIDGHASVGDGPISAGNAGDGIRKKPGSEAASRVFETSSDTGVSPCGKRFSL